MRVRVNVITETNSQCEREMNIQLKSSIGELPTKPKPEFCAITCDTGNTAGCKWSDLPCAQSDWAEIYESRSPRVSVFKFKPNHKELKTEMVTQSSHQRECHSIAVGGYVLDECKLDRIQSHETDEGKHAVNIDNFKTTGRMRQERTNSVLGKAIRERPF